MAFHDQHEPVAIAGMGCRWPGNVRSAPQLWEFLKTKGDGWREFDKPRFSAQGFHHPNANRPGTMSMKGAFLTGEDARLFDHAFFGITGLEAETLDPSQRKLLEVTYEALENAGETWESVSGSRTGVFIGNFCLDHWMIQSRDWDFPRPYAFTGAGTSILANRISYIFNLQGPSLTIDTACSSSMYALHLAVNAIRCGDCDSAIVASANWIADPSVQIALDKLGALSATGRCHTFDVAADGYARGEGFAALYLKKTSLAVATSSPIRAVIRGTAVNSNGRTGGITRPSIAGQEMVIREAYRNAGGLPFSETHYFECHGTGTYVGDPIEAAAVSNVFASERTSTHPLLIGSIKTNIGHTEGASALASIMKVVMSLEAGVIPPIYSFQAANPNIDFDRARLKVVQDLTPWPDGTVKRASINSFGYGGANGHCILEHAHCLLPLYTKPGVYQVQSSAPIAKVFKNGNHRNGYKNRYPNGQENSSHSPIVYPMKMVQTANAATRELVLLPFSAHNESSFSLNINALSQGINGNSLADVAFTLGVHRSRLSHRSFRIVEKDKIHDGLKAGPSPSRSPLQSTNLGFIFGGQGAQWHAMGAQLFRYRVFRTAISYMDHVLSALPVTRSWTLFDVLSGDCDPEMIHAAQITQTACTALQVGIVDLLASWSVRPSGVVGHSSGEIAASYASGYITAAEAILIAYFRGRVVSENKKRGLMLAVGLGWAEISSYLNGREEHVKVAAINSPNSVTLSGEVEAIEEVATTLTAKGVFNRVLRTDGNAYHSHHMAALGTDYTRMLSSGLAHAREIGLINTKQKYPIVPWISSVTPHKKSAKLEINSSYWRENLESPVRFYDAVAKLMSSEDNKIDAFLEIGPHSTLKGPLGQISKAKAQLMPYTSSLERDKDSQRSLLQLAGNLFCLNANIDLAAINAVDDIDGLGLEHGCIAIDLPPYQYTYAGLNYHESRASKEYRFREFPRHDILGSKIAGSARLRPQWRNILRLKDVPWLGDHRLLPEPVMPAAGCMVLAIEAASQAYHELPGTLEIKGFILRNVIVKTGMQISEDDYGLEVMVSLDLVDAESAKSPAWGTFSISSASRNSAEWTEHCTGHVKVEVAEMEDAEQISTSSMDPRYVDRRSWYKKFAAVGLGYGTTFQTLSDIQADPALGLAKAKLALKSTAGSIKGGESTYHIIHPAALDGAFQLGLIACHGGQTDKVRNAFVPTQLSEMRLRNDFDEDWDTVTVIAHGEQIGLKGAYINLQVLDPTGKILLDVNTLHCVRYTSESKSLDTTFSCPFSRLVWKPDIRTLNQEQCQKLFPPPKDNINRVGYFDDMQKFSSMVVFDMYNAFAESHSELGPSTNISHFLSWVRRRAEDKTPTMEEARLIATEELRKVIGEIYEKVSHVTEVQIAKCLHENIVEIACGRRTSVDVMIEKNLLTPLYEEGWYMTSAYPQLFNIIESLGFVNPNLKFLEIGGGTGGATRIAMRALTGPNGIKRYQEYRFTDISPGFLGSARESFSEFRDISFSVLDIESDPVEQGYHPTYDVLIASQVLHATVSISNTLANCRKLLKPGGKLVMVENTQNAMLAGIVLGMLTGYWHGVPEGRVDGPFISVESWDSALKEARFLGAELVLDDYPAPNTTTNVIVSTLIDDAVRHDEESNRRAGADSNSIGKVNLLWSGESLPLLGKQITQELERRGVQVKQALLRDALSSISPESHVIAFLGKNDILMDPDERGLEVFQHLAGKVASLVCITSCGVAKGHDPSAALVTGLLRVLSTENPAAAYLSIDIEADNFEVRDNDVANIVNNIIKQELGLQRGADPGLNDGSEDDRKDREFVWQDGCMWVSRLVPDGSFKSQDGLNDQGLKIYIQPLASQGAMRADFETPGIPSSIYFRPYKELWTPLPPDHIEVEVAAVGISWGDLDVWSGRADANHLSSEYSGVVTAIGDGVTSDFNIGDRVYGVGRGHFGNYTRVPAAFARKVPPRDSLLQAATMPLAYMAAVYAFDYLSQLKSGQKVLVQPAVTDFGVAAVYFAQAKGADVYAMAKTHEQAASISTSLNLLHSHVLLPRDLSSARRDTKWVFDVILSTAQGELLYTLLKALTPFVGHFVCVGRPDPQGAMANGRDLFQKNIRFSSFEPSSLILNDRSTLVEDLMTTVNDYYCKGLVRPIDPCTICDVANLPETLSTLSRDTHIGKIVVTFTNPESLVRMITPLPAVYFDSEACYVITGAFGGLGRSVVRWMSNRGAKHLVLVSRRHVDQAPLARVLLDSLTAHGIDIQPVICDISDRKQVIHMIEEAAVSRPIKGIVHAAVSYLDLSFDKLSLPRWQKSLEAKVQGTRNLHEASLSQPLDFFIMTTSLLAVYALATQGAYTAANNFQDAFARYRRRMGLPASTVSFSLISDVGNAATDPVTVDAFSRNKTLTLTENQFLTLLEPAFRNNSVQIQEDSVDSSLGSGQWLGQNKDPLSVSNLLTCLDPARMAAKQRQEVEAGVSSTAPPPRWHTDGRVSLIMRASADAQVHASSASVDSQNASGAGPKSAITRLRREFGASIQAGPSKRAEIIAFVQGAISITVAEMLFVDSEGIDQAKSVASHGVDSLIAAELRNWFHQALGANISMLDLLDPNTSISALSAKIVDSALAVQAG
ncbi:hypothetical protein F4803DRAFT_569116 [Xylaria telfairii]|nr:hypothetical protein F4803DRAFT_569116 [Xylaria telfairii]